MLNELHHGRDASPGWRWIIDVAGSALVLIGLTGLGIQLLLRKRRGSALTLSAIGAFLSVLFIWWAIA